MPSEAGFSRNQRLGFAAQSNSNLTPFVYVEGGMKLRALLACTAVLLSSPAFGQSTPAKAFDIADVRVSDRVIMAMQDAPRVRRPVTLKSVR